MIAAIAAAGGDLGADLVRYIGKRDDDPNWLKTDDAVGDTTELVIAGSDPNVANFVFSYFVGVDENGRGDVDDPAGRDRVRCRILVGVQATVYGAYEGAEEAGHAFAQRGRSGQGRGRIDRFRRGVVTHLDSLVCFSCE